MATSYNSKIVTDGLVLCLDAANPKSYSPNVHPNPTDIYSWVNTSVGNNCTLSRDTITSPVGTKPLKMVITGTDPYTPTYNNSLWNLLPAVAGQTWTVSVWVKASATTTIDPYIFGATAAGAYLEASSTGFNVTTSWTRISYSYTFTNASTTNLQIRLDGTQTGGTGVTIWWDGLQVERSSSMTTFNSKTNYNNTNWFDQSGSNNSVSGNLRPSTSTPGTVIDYNISAGITCSFPAINKYAFTFSYTGRGTGIPSSNYRQIFQFFDTNNIYYYMGDTREVATPSILHYVKDYTLNSWASAGALSNADYLLYGWNHFDLVVDNLTFTCYKNGVFQSTTTVTQDLSLYTNINKLVLNGSGSNSFQIQSAKLYNKVLTADQIKQNFNATRGRYGL